MFKIQRIVCLLMSVSMILCACSTETNKNNSNELSEPEDNTILKEDDTLPSDKSVDTGNDEMENMHNSESSNSNNTPSVEQIKPDQNEITSNEEEMLLQNNTTKDEIPQETPQKNLENQQLDKYEVIPNEPPMEQKLPNEKATIPSEPTMEQQLPNEKAIIPSESTLEQQLPNEKAIIPSEPTLEQQLPNDTETALDKFQVYNMLLKELTTSDYGGIFFEGEKVKILAVTEKKVTGIINELGISDYVIVEYAKYSKKKLNSIKNIITKLMDEHTEITSVGVNQSKNRVDVTVTDYPEDLKKRLNNIDSDCIKVIISQVTEGFDDELAE